MRHAAASAQVFEGHFGRLFHLVCSLIFPVQCCVLISDYATAFWHRRRAVRMACGCQHILSSSVILNTRGLPTYPTPSTLLILSSVSVFGSGEEFGALRPFSDTGRVAEGPTRTRSMTGDCLQLPLCQHHSPNLICCLNKLGGRHMSIRRLELGRTA